MRAIIYIFHTIAVVTSLLLVYHNNGNDYIRRSNAFTVTVAPPSFRTSVTTSKSILPTSSLLRPRQNDNPIQPPPASSHHCRYLFSGGGSGGGRNDNTAAKKRQQKELNPMWKTSTSPTITPKRWEIPITILRGLEDNTLKVPIRFRPVEKGVTTDEPSTTQSSSSDDEEEECVVESSIQLVIRQLEEEDVQVVSRICLKEYGSYANPTPPTSTNAIDKFLYESETVQYIEDLIFSFVVLAGMTQRMKRRKVSTLSSDTTNTNANTNAWTIPDHNVLCLSQIVTTTTHYDDVCDTSTKETIVGMAEVSLQPPDPNRTAPPFVLPTPVKNAICTLLQIPPPCPYISNVLVVDSYRGLGYGKVLMAACEGLALEWGYDAAYLHVEAGSGLRGVGTVAQGLYKGLGYVPVDNREMGDDKYSWMGPEKMYKGMYVVDGMALLYMKKDLVGGEVTRES